MAPEYIHTVDITVQIDTNKQTKRKSFDAIAPALTYLRDVAYGPNSASFDDDSMTGWVARIMEWCERKGWNDGLERRSFGDWCTLMHTEISEAYEEYRDGHALDEVYRKRVTGEDGGSYDHAKPEGVPTEIADLLIRVFHLCAHLKLNPGVLIAQKMAYNETRPYRHGGKVA